MCITYLCMELSKYVAKEISTRLKKRKKNFYRTLSDCISKHLLYESWLTNYKINDQYVKGNINMLLSSTHLLYLPTLKRYMVSHYKRVVFIIGFC